MCSIFTLKLLSCTNGNLKRLLFSTGRINVPLKIYSFIRVASTACSEVLISSNTEDTEFSSKELLGENYFTKYLLRQPEYRGLVFDKENLNFETEGRPETIQILQNLSNNKSENDKSSSSSGSSSSNLEETDLLERLKTSLLKEKESLDVEEICKAFFLMRTYSQNPCRSEILQLLQDEVASRKFTKPQALMLLFASNNIKISEQGWFLKRKIRYKFYNNLKALTKEQLIILLFCITPLHDELQKLIKFNMFQRLNDVLPSLNGTELGIMSMGLLRGKFNGISKELINSLIKRATELSADLPDESLRYICKVIHRSSLMFQGPGLLELQESFIPHIPKMNHFVLTFLSTVGINFGCISLNFWENVAPIFKDNMNNYSSAEVLRISEIITSCGIQDEELLKLTTEWFERALDNGTLDNQLERQHLVFFLNNLIHFKLYPKRLLDFAYARGLEYFKSSSGKHTKRTVVTYWNTKCCLDIDKPEFNYDSFTEQQQKKLNQLCHFLKVPEKSNFVNLSWPMHKALKNLYGEENKLKYFYHPVYSLGFFMRFDQNLNAQPIPEVHKQSSKIVKALKDGHIWIILFLWKNSWSSETEQLNDLRLETTIRHLQAFGYDPIRVELHEFIRYRKRNTLSEFLQNLINSHLQKYSAAK